MDKPTAFSVAIPADLTHVLRGRGVLPGVRDVIEPSGNWDSAGDSRRVVMTDGSSAKETLTHYNDPDGIAYLIDAFKGPLGNLVTHSTGEWRFSAEADNKTHVEWTFTFHPRSSLTAPLVSFIAKRLWPGYASAALTRVKELAEQS